MILREINTLHDNKLLLLKYQVNHVKIKSSEKIPYKIPYIKSK